MLSAKTGLRAGRIDGIFRGEKIHNRSSRNRAKARLRTRCGARVARTLGRRDSGRAAQLANVADHFSRVPIFLASGRSFSIGIMSFCAFAATSIAATSVPLVTPHVVLYES